MILLNLLLAAIFTEALTQLAIHADILEPIRAKIRAKSNFFNKLLQCGYCFSVWTAWPAVYIVFTPIENLITPNFINIFIWTMIIHRLSNFVDDFADRYLREPETIDPAAYFAQANNQFSA